jgi:hypothetical protein
VTATINYDLPIANFIDRLSETEHVTHTQHRKDIVTIHHNGGRLSHEGVLSVWQTREASAHFNFDAKGTPAQFVRPNEYAWSTGNTEGNVRSISIEMCNETVAPEWKVGDLTVHGAARLTAWIHWKIFGWRPSRDSVVPHHHWSSTACAGPYMDQIFDRFVEIAVQYYDEFTAGTGFPSTPPPSSGGGSKSVDQLADEVIDGEWGNGDDRRQRLQNAGYDYDAVQAEVNHRFGGPDPTAPSLKSNDEIVDEVLRGLWGNDPQRREQLIAAGYDARAIQAEVNVRYGSGAPRTDARPGPRSVASAVIRGEWDNGDERRRRLEAAGYDYQQIQDEVNRQLGL